jgi:preprotein translocase subunit Sec61beta
MKQLKAIQKIKIDPVLVSYAALIAIALVLIIHLVPGR